MEPISTYYAHTVAMDLRRENFFHLSSHPRTYLSYSLG